MKHTARFGQFDDRERDLLRMALRRLYDQRIMAIDRGLADPTPTENDIAALIYELYEK